MLTALAHLTIVALLAQTPTPTPTPPALRPAPPATPLQPAPPAEPPATTAPQPAPVPAPAPTQAEPARTPPAGPAAAPPAAGAAAPVPQQTDPGPQPAAPPPPAGDFLPPGMAPAGERPPQPPPPEPHERRYGDQGTSEVSLGLGYTQQSGFVGGGGFRRYLLNGIGPGVEGTVQRHDGQTLGFLLGSLRLVPVRERVAALVLTARAGRVFLSDHDDGWGAGGGVGVIFFLAPGIGIELSYAVLWLMPSHFCADLTSCTIKGPDIGLRVGF